MRIALILTVLLLVPVAAQSQADVTVAVLDTGVDASHPELSGRVERMDFTSPLQTPLPPAAPDHDGRGTAVASVVAGATIGFVPEARVLDLKVVSALSGTGLDPATEQNAADAMDHILNMDELPDVVVLGFAESGVTDIGAPTLAALAEALFDRGVLVVVPTADRASALHMDPHVFTVGPDDACAAGTLQEGRPVKPDLVTQAQDVEAARLTPPLGQGGTGPEDGIALAAARVAGAAALIMQQYPEHDAATVAAILRDTALGDGPDACSGWGNLDVTSALALARELPDDQIGRDIPLPSVGLLLVGLVVVARRRVEACL